MVRDRTGEADGLEAVELAVASARDAGRGFAEQMVRGYAAQMHAVRGHREQARAHLAAVAAAGAAWWGSTIVTASAGALVALVDDDATGMLRALEPVLRPEVLALADAVGALAPRVLHTEALLRLGRMTEAGAALDALEARLARPPAGPRVGRRRPPAGSARGGRGGPRPGERGLRGGEGGRRRRGDPARARPARDRARPPPRGRGRAPDRGRPAAHGPRPAAVPRRGAVPGRLRAPPARRRADAVTGGRGPRADPARGRRRRARRAGADEPGGRAGALRLPAHRRLPPHNVYAKLGVTSRAQLRERTAVPAR